jgi:hypothetical protein
VSSWCKFKIVRMHGGDQEDVPPDRLAEAIRKLQELSPSHGVQVYPDAEPGLDGHWQFPRLSIGWSDAGTGYVVQCFETPDSNSCLLATDTSLSEPKIEAGIGELWPGELFVPFGTAMAALDHFLATALQSPLLHWLALAEFPRVRLDPKPRAL